MIRASGLGWLLLRLAATLPVELIMDSGMFDVPLDNRIEFVHRDDAVTALAAAVAADAGGRVFNIAGGPSWRVLGETYVRDFFERLGVDASEAIYQDHPGHFDWYDTGDGQAALRYQNNSYGAFFQQLDAEIARMLEE